MGELSRVVILLQLLMLFLGADDVAGQLAHKYHMPANEITSWLATCASPPPPPPPPLSIIIYIGVQFSEETFTVEEGQQLSITLELLNSNGNVLATPTTSDIQVTLTTDVTLGMFY